LDKSNYSNKKPRENLVVAIPEQLSYVKESWLVISHKVVGKALEIRTQIMIPRLNVRARVSQAMMEILFVPPWKEVLPVPAVVETVGVEDQPPGHQMVLPVIQ